MNQNALEAKLANLQENGKSLKSLNFVSPDAQGYPTSGDYTIAAGEYPEPVCQPGVSPWFRYPTNDAKVAISKTALLGNRHFSNDESTARQFSDLKSRTTLNNSIDELFDIKTLEIKGETIAVAVPKVPVKVTFKDGGTVYVPAKTDGSQIITFKKKDNYPMLTVSRA